MTAFDTLHVLTPTYKPVGGVVKLMDYVQHARSVGMRVSIWSSRLPMSDEPLFSIRRFADLPDAADVGFVTGRRIAFGADDVALVSLPRNYEVLHRSLPEHLSPERVVHLVQNVRHINPSWGDGYPTRLLTRPLARISINAIVADAIAPWLDPRALHEVIDLGHDVDFFARHRDGTTLHRPLRVASTAWKSDIGDRVADELAGDDSFEFRAIRETANWEQLRDLYHWSDVFLSSPGPEEGLYLPGLEAMAAETLVVTPDVGGNMAYCEPDANCLLARFEDPKSYVAALRSFAAMDQDDVSRFRRSGRVAAQRFDLAAERRGFVHYLDRLADRVTRFEGSTTRR